MKHTNTPTHTSIEGIFTKLFNKLHKIALDELDFFLELGLGGVLTCPLDLEIVIVETNDVDIGEGGNFTSGSANTTSDIEDAHARLQLHHMGEVVFMAGELRGMFKITR